MSKTIKDVFLIDRSTGKAFHPEWPDQDPGKPFVETEWRCMSGTASSYLGGVWDGEPGELNLPSYPYDEICIMISGKVALRDVHGGRREFAQGDAFFVPRGFSGVWETIEPSSKYFIAIE